MTGVRLAIRVICLLVVLSAIALQCCQARGGRGGGGGARGGGGSRGSRGGSRGSSRYSSSSSSSRGLSRSFRSSSVQRGTSPYTRSNWKHYAGLGLIYGSRHYTRTRRYHTHPDEMPTVCTNQHDKSPEGTVYGYFICPREGEDDDMNFCCGDDEKEFCCRNNGLSTGAVVGITLAPLLAAGLIALLIILIICCCTKDKKNTGAASRSVHYQARQRPRTSQAPFSTTLSKQHPDISSPAKKLLPRSDVSNFWAPSPSPRQRTPPLASAPPPAFQYRDPPVSSSVPTSPPDGPPTGPTGASPSDPPPPYVSLSVGEKEGGN